MIRSLPAIAAALAAAGALAAAPCLAAGGSGHGPLALPCEVRLAQQAKGNLAPNSSFERMSPTGGMGEPHGWSRVGEQVEWVDREAGAGEDEVRHGRRAIKVHRATAGELDEAEGVMSDFIPVIPGTYDLTCDLRLKRIDPQRRRWGARLGDMNPVGAGPIDASDKSYTFANYWSIDDFPWATVRPRTYNYPFSEGDLPEQTRYVRLFFGLKGAGTLWLDNVEFRYSKWNFTALERMQPYIGRPLSQIEALIPTPK
ncbi:MAG: hypothetical protein MUF46_06295, partial [Desulfobacterales bacterium]|nr:hypothetical protein [Desulfobacterales bacterium]